MAQFFKGAGVGTHWHINDARLSGFTPRMPGAPFSSSTTIIDHIRIGTAHSPCVSLTRSFGVAEAYALDWSAPLATRSLPAFVYEIDVPDGPRSGFPSTADPVWELAQASRNPLSGLAYHHDGDMNFLLGIVRPRMMASYLGAPIRLPLGAAATPRPANLMPCLEALVRALRDAELLVIGTVPAPSVIKRHSVF